MIPWSSYSTATLNQALRSFKLDNATLRYGTFLVVIEEDPKNHVMRSLFACHISPFAKKTPAPILCFFACHIHPSISILGIIAISWMGKVPSTFSLRPATCSSRNFSLPFAVGRWRWVSPTKNPMGCACFVLGGWVGELLNFGGGVQ